MKLVEYNATVLVEGTPEEHDFLYDYLAFRDRNRDYLARTRKWMDPFIRLFNPRASTFPGGLLPMVAYAAAEACYPVERESRVQPPTTDDGGAVTPQYTHAQLMQPRDEGGLGLRDYQADALMAITRERRGIIKIATAGGKGSLAAALPEFLPCRWLFVVHRAQIARDIAERYRANTKIEPGFILEGDVALGEGQFVVATFQSLRKRIREEDPRLMEWLDTVGGVVFDEAHVVGADTFAEVAGAVHAPYYRIGMSGTPLQRNDGRTGLVIGWCGTIIYEATAADLIKQGYIAPVQVRALWYTPPGPSAAVTWSGVYADAVVRSSKRAHFVADAIAAAPKPALVFVTAIKHGVGLKKLLEKRGMRVAFVKGDVPVEVRERMGRGLTAGWLDVIIASKVFEEGIDLPALECVIHAGGGKSEIGTLQRVGRGMRLSPGKTHVEMIDIVDGMCPECAGKKMKDHSIHKSCRWLVTHSRGRIAAYKREQHPVTEYTAPEAVRQSLQGTHPMEGMKIVRGSQEFRVVGGRPVPTEES